MQNFCTFLPPRINATGGGAEEAPEVEWHRVLHLSEEISSPLGGPAGGRDCPPRPVTMPRVHGSQSLPTLGENIEANASVVAGVSAKEITTQACGVIIDTAKRNPCQRSGFRPALIARGGERSIHLETQQSGGAIAGGRSPEMSKQYQTTPVTDATAWRAQPSRLGRGACPTLELPPRHRACTVQTT